MRLSIVRQIWGKDTHRLSGPIYVASDPAAALADLSRIDYSAINVSFGWWRSLSAEDGRGVSPVDELRYC